MTSFSSDSSGSDLLPTKRRRVPLARAFRSLRKRLNFYRGLALVAAVALAGLGTFTLTQASTSPEPVPLGTGRAGVLPDAVAEAPAPEPIEPLPAEPLPVEPEEAPPLESLGRGEASYYGDALAGRPTASGETFDPAKLTAAHRTLPLGSRVRVTNTRNGESVVVRINDRGPFHGERVIDLSKAAAREIGMLRRGTARVHLELLTRI